MVDAVAYVAMASNPASAALFDPRSCDDAHGHGHSHGHGHGHGQPEERERREFEGTENGGHAAVGSHGHAHDHTHGPGDPAAPTVVARGGNKRFSWLLVHDGNTKRLFIFAVSPPSPPSPNCNSQ